MMYYGALILYKETIVKKEYEFFRDTLEEVKDEIRNFIQKDKVTEVYDITLLEIKETSVLNEFLK